MDSKTVITKETKNKIRVDYEGKLTVKERLIKKFKESHTWIKAAVTVIRFILMLGVSYVILYPFIAKIAGSFMSREDIVDATVALIPKHFTLEIYRSIIVDNHYFEAVLNTFILSLLAALIQTFVACLIGYGLAKFKFKGNKAVMVAVVLTMIIPHSALKLPIMQHFTNFDILAVQSWNMKGPIELIFGEALHLDDTYWPYVVLSITGLAFKNGLYIYLMRQFFKGVPDELEESAYVDGCGTFRTFLQIIIPLSVPMMITIFLFSFSWQWTDEFYKGMFFMTSTPDDITLWLMPDIVYAIPSSLNTEYAGKTLYENVINNTSGMMGIAPLIILYLFGQRYLVQGIERSGIVG